MTDRELMQQALEDICGARLCEVNSMSSRHEMLRLMDKAITALRDRLAQNLEMDEAIAAGDGTLHGAIDYWQERALKAEARLAQKDEPSAERLHEMTALKNAAYAERNKVVAGFAALAMKIGYAACRTRTEIEGWSDDWHGCVYIQLPTGQVSWHYHDSEAELFSFLPENAVTWDGHDTDEKYRRVLMLAQEGEPNAEPVAYRLHKTDIYDFAGWLTTRPGLMLVGSGFDAALMAEAVGEYIRTFPERFTAPQTRKPLTDEEINDEMDRLLLSPVEQEAFGSGVRYAERKHGIGEKQ